MSSKSCQLLEGRFALDARIGEGTFAEIYRATDTQTGNVVAVKTLRPEHTAKRNAIALFRQEGEIGSSLSHANVVKVWTYGETAGTYFIVMELVTGVSLRRRMRRSKTIPVAESLRIIRAVLRGLEAIHASGYIHRDIKPQNILLEANGTPKITDFGITLRAGGIRATDDGMTLGTAAYIAPEQAAGWEIGPPADLYATGVLLYEMLTGEVPFPGDDPIEVMHRHMFETPRDPRSLNPEISPALAAVILRALAKEPDARFPSAQEMYGALEMLHIDAEHPRPTRKPVTRAPVTQRKPGRIARMPFLTTFVGALLLAVLIIVIALALVSSAVTANDSSKNISSSSVPSGFANVAPTPTGTPQKEIQSAVAIPPTSTPDLQRFDNASLENHAPVVTPTASATPKATATPSPTPAPKATTTPESKRTATATATPKPTATPGAEIAAAKKPTPPAKPDTPVATKKPVVSNNDQAASSNADSQTDNADKDKKKKKRPATADTQANPPNPPSAADPSSNQSADAANANQPINSGFGATQNITNAPNDPNANPVVSNSGESTGSGNGPNADGPSSQTDDSSKGPADDHHHRDGGG